MVVATGFFDGVHLGHRLVVGKLVETAKAVGEESTVITLWPHPRNVLQQEARNLRLLTTMQEKKDMLMSLGVDRVEVLRFTKQFSSLTTEDYLKEYVMGRFGASSIVLGYDNRMGSDAANVESVKQVAERLGLKVYLAEKKTTISGLDISSTKIRKLLDEGDVSGANEALGYEYSLLGVVVSGDRIGRRVLGFPTANMQLYEPLKLVPANGVYSVKVTTLGKEFTGMCNIGNRPTVAKGNARTIETHIFDFDEDIYGLDIKVTFLKRIREEIRFSSFAELKAQLERDKMFCKSMN